MKAIRRSRGVEDKYMVCGNARDADRGGVDASTSFSDPSKPLLHYILIIYPLAFPTTTFFCLECFVFILP